ncbi:MAG: hypothetical protein JWN38_357 [Candidatus Saccharibacteria bacterium]|nr:hypothetical protein [Candidatus Saccharibacteria bacterium]
MGIFKDNSPEENWQSAAEVDSYQAAAIDPKTVAPQVIMDNLLDFQISQIHPWQASDFRLIQMAGMCIAYANDRLAEILIDEGIRTSGRKDKRELPADINYFAGGLSQNAHNILTESRKLNKYSDVGFTEESIDNLSPDQMTPWWPYFEGRELESWQRVEAGVVSMPFIRGVARATRELMGDTEFHIQQLKDRAVVAVPRQYKNNQADLLRDVIDAQLLMPARVDIETAEGMLDGTRELTEGSKVFAYNNAHDAYVRTMAAFTGIYCPPALGIDFIPERS